MFSDDLIWLLPSVSPKMGYKMIIIIESFVTIDASIWFLPSVISKMDYKTTICCESLVTIITFIWFLPSVSPKMGKEIDFEKKPYHSGCTDMASLQCKS